MLGTAVSQALRDAAYAVDWLRDGLSVTTALATHRFALILLDLNLPGVDGIDVLRVMRAKSDATPVLVITARDSVDQKIDGLDRGADDYLVKPFAVGELLARIRALCRRSSRAGSPLMTNGTLSLDPTSKAVTVDGIDCRLSNREFALLRELLIRPGAVLSRAELEERLYGWGKEVESNVVEYIIHGLRRKLGMHAIRNVRGLGWMVERAGGRDAP